MSFALQIQNTVKLRKKGNAPVPVLSNDHRENRNRLMTGVCEGYAFLVKRGMRFFDMIDMISRCAGA
jgi:hypothetical protein